MVDDVDQDVLHLVAELRVSDATVAQHYAMIRQLDQRIFNRHMDFPIAWPADAGTRDKGSGEPVKNLYKQFGLRMMACRPRTQTLEAPRPIHSTAACRKSTRGNRLASGKSRALVSATSRSAGFITARTAT